MLTSTLRIRPPARREAGGAHRDDAAARTGSPDGPDGPACCRPRPARGASRRCRDCRAHQSQRHLLNRIPRSTNDDRSQALRGPRDPPREHPAAAGLLSARLHGHHSRPPRTRALRPRSSPQRPVGLHLPSEHPPGDRALLGARRPAGRHGSGARAQHLAAPGVRPAPVHQRPLPHPLRSALRSPGQSLRDLSARHRVRAGPGRAADLPGAGGCGLLLLRVAQRPVRRLQPGLPRHQRVRHHRGH